jgi:hypothetical protein
MTTSRDRGSGRAYGGASTASVVALWAALAGCGGGGGSSDNNTPPTVNGPAWAAFARDAQHSAQSGIATQPLGGQLWETPVDLVPQYASDGSLLIHYGSPVITAHNTVVVPVRTASGGVRVEAHAGSNGGLLWSADSDYVIGTGSPGAWAPSYGIALTPGNRLYFAGAHGTMFYRDDVDNPNGIVKSIAVAADMPGFPSQINAALTVDAAGTLYFAFGADRHLTPQSSIVRITIDGTVTLAAMESLIPPILVGAQRTFPQTNSAPALSPDGATLYAAINGSTGDFLTPQTWLVAVDAKTLAFRSRVALLDPVTREPSLVSLNGTASPTVGPDGDVYFGVLESTPPAHNFRGWLLHFDATLATSKVPAAFGWDDTASVVPATMVPSYTGASSYLLAIKYNNYGGVGTGDGKNRMAIVDPGAVQTDVISGQPVMKEVLTILGPTPDPGFPGGVREWCINTAAVDPFTRSVLVNSGDGMLYRWSLVTNTLTEKIRLGDSIGEAYTPTLIGPDGAVYAINNAVLYAIGQ